MIEDAPRFRVVAPRDVSPYVQSSSVVKISVQRRHEIEIVALVGTPKDVQPVWA